MSNKKKNIQLYSELIKETSEMSGVPKYYCTAVVACFVQAIRNALYARKDVRIRRLGIFKLYKHKMASVMYQGSYYRLKFVRSDELKRLQQAMNKELQEEENADNPEPGLPADVPDRDDPDVH